MQNKWIPLLVSLGIGMGCTHAIADVSNPASELVNALEKIKTLDAHFTQKITDAQSEPVSKAKGQMMVQRPNQFLWKSETPDPIKVIADGKFLWTYDIDLAQVTKQSLDKALKNSPAAFLAGDANDLKKHYNVSYAKPENCPKGTDQCFELLPIEKGGALTSIILGFTQNKLTEMRMKDALGQNIHTIFTQVKINEPIDQKLFSFTPPKGVDVLSPEQ